MISRETLEAIELTVRRAVREELADAGLRLDGDDHQDQAREDFRFLRRFRTAFDGAAGKIGSAVIMSLLVIAGTILTLGFWAWLKGGIGLK